MLEGVALAESDADDALTVLLLERDITEGAAKEVAVMRLEDDVRFIGHLPNLDQSIALAQLRRSDELIRSLEFRGLDELHHRVSRREDQGPYP